MNKDISSREDHRFVLAPQVQQKKKQKKMNQNSRPLSFAISINPKTWTSI